MADATQKSPFAPHPAYPEKATPVWERKFHNTGTPGRKGPLRFEEGIATDRDIPAGFTTGITQGYETAPGRPNHNKKVDTKYPAETLAERAHVGSASWVEAPTMLGEFSQGMNADKGAIHFEVVHRDGGHYNRVNYARVMD